MSRKQNTPSLDWNIQFTKPTPDRVGLIASTENARRSIAGILVGLANAWPADDDLIPVVIDHDKQTDYLWIATQIAALPALQVTVTVLASGATPTVSVDAAGVLQIGIPESSAGSSYSLGL